MSKIKESVDVAVPVRAAYNEWTQFEEFPQFMEGIDRIEQSTETRTHWETSIAGVRREFEAEIIEQHPDDSIAWSSTGRPLQAGVISFHHLGPDQTRVTLQMDYEPEGLAERAGDRLGIIRHRIRRNLERFKHYAEAYGGGTRGWRGEINPDPRL
ncbi:SRPBCC family protein [Actinomadura scrupuli]|uniref:SRPBCC family protein n=1 Tax=Actinomadura scrupuli TaxID=559629 RepID=UPI003D960AB4